MKGRHQRAAWSIWLSGRDKLLLKKHAPILASRGHHGKYSRIDPKLYGAKATALYWQVDWDNTWETEEAMHNQPESAALFERYMSRAATMRCTAQQRADMSLTALQQQGHGYRQLYHQGLSLRKEPALAKNICINTSSTVNPDRDIVGTGNYHIQQDQLDSDLASIHSPAGAFLGTITRERLNILDRAYRQPPSGTFARAVASLLTRYKDSGPTEEIKANKDEQSLGHP